MDSVLQDVRYAIRRLWKSKAFAALAIFILAMAIGANTTVFSLVNALLLQPFPGVRQSDQLVAFSGSQSYPNYLEFRNRAKAFSGVIATRIAPMSLSLGSGNERAWGYEATGNYFQVLGVRPAIGRFFTPAEDRKPGGDPYAVISYAAWQHWFGGSPNVVNRSIQINGLKYTVWGVAPKGFIGTEFLYKPQIWVPMSMEPQIEPGNSWLNERSTWDIWVAGRIKPGISQAQAQNDVDTISAQLGKEYPRFDRGMHVRLGRPGYFRSQIANFFAVVMGVAGLVLLLACMNLASFLLARSADGRKETAIRIALGAGRLRLMRQFLTESALLAAAGGGAGLFIAWWAAAWISSSRFPIDIPVNTTVAIDHRVLAFAIAGTVLTVLFFGLAPALQAARPNVVPALKSESWSRRLRRWELRDVFVAAQVALSVVLLGGSALVVRSLQNALDVNIGFNPKHAAAVAFDLGLQGYSEALGRQFLTQLLHRVQSTPGIESATVTDSVPLTLNESTTWIMAYGKPIPKPGDRAHATFYNAGPNYFHTLETPILRGRDFNWHDTANSEKVVVINRALAKRLFPNGDALGKRIGFGETSWYTVVGIVETGKYRSLNDENEPAIFWPILQRYNTPAVLVARSPMPPAALLSTLRNAVSRMDASMPIYDAKTLEQYLNLPLTPARLAVGALGTFGFLAVILAAAGIYGAMAYSVARRTREIGIRVALGATRQNVLRLVLSRTAIVLLVGTCAGVAGALAAGNLFRAVLYGISPKDPATYTVVVVLMIAVALVAALAPAQRALRVDPAHALREE